MAFSTADKWFDSLWDFPIFFKHSFMPIVDFFVFPVQKISSLQYIRLQHSYPDLQIKTVYTVLLVLILQDPHFILLFHGICQMNLRYIYIYRWLFLFISLWRTLIWPWALFHVYRLLSYPWIPDQMFVQRKVLN